VLFGQTDMRVNELVSLYIRICTHVSSNTHVCVPSMCMSVYVRGQTDTRVKVLVSLFMHVYSCVFAYTHACRVFMCMYVSGYIDM
jgi:hypothetical protein